MADIINELLGMDDEALGEKLGFDDKVKQFKTDLASADALTGKARDKIVRSLQDMFTPRTYAMDDLKWQLEQANQKTKTGCCPQEVVSCACGDD